MRRYELMMFPRALGKVAFVGGHFETLAEALEEVRLWCIRGVPDRSCEELNFWRAWRVADDAGVHVSLSMYQSNATMNVASSSHAAARTSPWFIRVRFACRGVVDCIG